MSITTGIGDFMRPTLRRLVVTVIAACLVLAACGGSDSEDNDATAATSTISGGGDDTAGPIAVRREDPPPFPLDGFAAEDGAEVWTVTDAGGQEWTVVTTTEPSAYVAPAAGGSCDDLDPVAVLAAIPDWDVPGPWACY